jgi:hypothetical protein
MGDMYGPPGDCKRFTSPPGLTHHSGIWCISLSCRAIFTTHVHIGGTQHVVRGSRIKRDTLFR